MLVLLAAPANAGNPIVFSRVDASTNFPDSELYTIGLDGGGLKRLTKNNKGDASPSFSPDGKKIVYECKGAVGDQGYQIRGEICVSRSGGSRRRVLTASGRNVGFHEPSWSPNGRWIAFIRIRRCPSCSDANRFTSDLMLMAPDGSGRHALTKDDQFDADPTWAPGSRRIAFTRESVDGLEVAVIGRRGGDPYMVTYGATLPARQPAWSPDGRLIAFTGGENSSLMLMRADGRRIRTVVEGELAYGPAWSPSGNRLVFTYGDDLFQVKRDGSELKRITGSSSSSQLFEFDADWR
jgi:Tol biopolymer transport system component